MSENLLGIAQQVVGSFLVAHDVNQLQVLPCEQQAVEVGQVDISRLVILQSFSQSWNDGPLLLYPGYKIEKRVTVYPILTIV